MPLQPEQIVQINLVAWFNYTYPELENHLFHFANERKCSLQYGATLKRMGVKKGVYDIFLSVPHNDKAGLWLELKVGRNKATPEQLEFGKLMNKNGYKAIIVWGLDAAKNAIQSYLNNYPLSEIRPA